MNSNQLYDRVQYTSNQTNARMNKNVQRVLQGINGNLKRSAVPKFNLNRRVLNPSQLKKQRRQMGVDVSDHPNNMAALNELNLQQPYDRTEATF